MTTEHEETAMVEALVMFQNFTAQYAAALGGLSSNAAVFFRTQSP